MVPWSEFGHIPPAPGREFARALELIGVLRVPSDEEKKEAHRIVEDFATGPLPEAFSYTQRGRRDKWPVYPQKLLPETWRLLRDTGLAGEESGRGVPVTQATGLSLLSILADCCAGQTLARITDQSAAYATLTGLLARPNAPNEYMDTMEGLAALTIEMVDADKISIRKLVDFRQKEATSPKGHELRLLRHRYLQRLSDQAASLVRLPKKSDREEARRQFAQETNDDLRHLHSELGLAAREVIATKEVLVAVLAGMATIASEFMNVPIRNVIAPTGGLVSIGGVFATGTRFARSRREVLQRHPMAYLYELKGGVRI